MRRRSQKLLGVPLLVTFWLGPGLPHARAEGSPSARKHTETRAEAFCGDVARLPPFDPSTAAHPIVAVPIARTRLAGKRPLAADLVFERGSQNAASVGNLSDSQRDSVWRAHIAAGAPGARAAASARRQLSGFAIAAFAIYVDGGKTGELKAPASLWFVGPDGTRIAVTLPASAPLTQPLMVIPKTPLAWSCVSVVMGPSAPPGGAASLGLREVQTYTELDDGDPIPKLLARADEPGAGGRTATRLLGRLPGGADALIAAWPTLSELGQRRALQVLPRSDKLAALLRREGCTGVAEEALLKEDPARVLPVLLGALEGAVEARPSLRRTIGRVSLRATAKAHEALRGWWGRTPKTEDHSGLTARIDALRGLSANRALHPELRQKAGELVGEAHNFDNAWGLVLLFERVGEPDSDLAVWVTDRAKHAEPWMLRARALAALAERAPAPTASVASKALSDAYPRVRATAAATLTGHAAAATQLAQLASGDRWPIVRAAAFGALARIESAQPVLLKGLDDRSPRVRSAAIEALTTAREPAAQTRIQQVLSQASEPTAVLLAAVEYARVLQLDSSAEALAALVNKAQTANDAADGEVGRAALQALRSIDGPKSRAAAQAFDAPVTQPSGQP